nr:MAG TPA: hypothetical protein [Caudoviricetes sp.]
MGTFVVSKKNLPYNYNINYIITYIAGKPLTFYLPYVILLLDGYL